MDSSGKETQATVAQQRAGRRRREVMRRTELRAPHRITTSRFYILKEGLDFLAARIMFIYYFFSFFLEQQKIYYIKRHEAWHDNT
jgi:hypothetical protein